jgi:hypothetical protein
MKKLGYSLFAAFCLSSAAWSSVAKAETVDYQYLTLAGYLNFYLLNLNACEDYHPAIRQQAYDAEKQLYPWLSKLEQKLKDSDADNKTLSEVVHKRRAALNQQISEGDFTLDHCKAVVKLLSVDGLDQALLKTLN